MLVSTYNFECDTNNNNNNNNDDDDDDNNSNNYFIYTAKNRSAEVKY